MNQGAFLMRGLEKARGEFSLTALTNLRGRQHSSAGKADGAVGVKAP